MRKNPHLARLDRQLRLHGEPAEIVRVVGSTTQTKNRADCRAIVKTLTVEQVAGNVTQTKYLVILSPTDLRHQWSGGRGPATVASGNLPTGYNPVRDFTIPTINEKIVFRSTEKAISLVNAQYDRGECVRIEVEVLG